MYVEEEILLYPLTEDEDNLYREAYNKVTYWQEIAEDEYFAHTEV